MILKSNSALVHSFYFNYQGANKQFCNDADVYAFSQHGNLAS